MSTSYQIRIFSRHVNGKYREQQYLIVQLLKAFPVVLENSSIKKTEMLLNKQSNYDTLCISYVFSSQVII